MSPSATASASSLPHSLKVETFAKFRHGFFTRDGGVSRAPYDSLNTSAATGDSPSCVAENCARVAAAFDVPPHLLFVTTQVHGTASVEVSASDLIADIAACKADILVSRDPRVTIAIRTADCVPILLAEPVSGAVAAIHAGWRGIVDGVVRAGVKALLACAGSNQITLLHAAVGPHISTEAFEVDAAVGERLQACAPTTDVVYKFSQGKVLVDLRSVVEQQLRACGVQSVAHARGCTVLAPRFFSFRRDGQSSGRMISAIRPIVTV
jgi:polyphenol oxidase